MDRIFSDSAYFQPDIFSKPGPRYLPVNDKEAELVRNVIRGRYPHICENGTIQVFCVVGNEINSKNFKIMVDSDRLFIKRMKKDEKERIAFLAGMHSRMVEAGLRVPRVINDMYDNMCVYGEYGYNWMLMEYMEGSFFDGLSTNALLNIADTYSNMQLHLSSVSTTVTVPLSKRLPIIQGDERDVWRYVLDNSEDWRALLSQGVANSLKSHFPNLQQAIDSVDFFTIDSGSLQTSLTHIDWHPYNCLLIDDQVSCILDIDSIIQASVPVMASYGAYKMIRQFICVNKREDFIIRKTIRGYCERLQILNMDLSEYNMFAKIELLRRIFIILRLAVIQGNKDWCHILPMHLAGINEVDLIFNAN